MKRLSNALGTISLTAILAFGVYGVVVNVYAGQSPGYVSDEVYDEECGACHLAYPPGLLPASSWDKVMAGLADHFGDNAELDPDTTKHLADYLQKEALRPGKPTVMNEMLRNLPADTPIRITELPAFLAAHEPVAEQMEMATWPEGFLSPCADCHRQAADARFEKELMHPGYGPSNWGGPQDED